MSLTEFVGLCTRLLLQGGKLSGNVQILKQKSSARCLLKIAKIIEFGLESKKSFFWHDSCFAHRGIVPSPLVATGYTSITCYYFVYSSVTLGILLYIFCILVHMLRSLSSFLNKGNLLAYNYLVNGKGLTDTPQIPA